MMGKARRCEGAQSAQFSRLYNKELISYCLVSSIYSVVPATQSAFTCSKLSIETLQQDVHMFIVNNKDANGFVLVSSLLTLNIISHLVLVFLLIILRR